MHQPSLSPLRRALVVATIAGLAATPAALASPAKKSKAAARSAAADLVIRDLQTDFAGETLTVFADVANQGGKKARRSDVVIAFSSDAVLDDEDEIVDEISTRKLKPGKSREIGTEAEVPTEEDLEGSELYVIVCADAGNVVKEKVESNNCASELIASASEGDEVVSEDDAADEEAAPAEDDAPADSEEG